MMRILICGARDFSDKIIIDNFILSLEKDTVIIEGEAKGADSIARDCAIFHGLTVEKYPADWKIGRKAGPIRNKQMLVEGKPDYVVGYSNDIKSSRGTRNMLKQALKAGIEAYLNISDAIDIELGVGQVKLEDLE